MKDNGRAMTVEAWLTHWVENIARPSVNSMAKRYQHVTAVLRNDIASRLDGFLWGPNETETETGR